ncbi:unnamed protein product [Lymnaea stagnalis]|uniref:Mitochondrial fission 1 protein n=1 Tax=Lymnaea stagnalis TaxID=6523 RepID=A0AAV2HGS1_LYMST
MESIIQDNVDPIDLKNYEALYNEQSRRGHVNEKTQFDYALCLVRSRYIRDMEKGIALLEDLLRNTKDEMSKRDYLFYIAVGFVRLKEYGRAIEYTEAICKIEPGNRQAKQLESYAKGKMNTDGLIGMAIVGGAVLAVGGIIGATVAAFKKKPKK